MGEFNLVICRPNKCKEEKCQYRDWDKNTSKTWNHKFCDVKKGECVCNKGYKEIEEDGKKVCK